MCQTPPLRSRRRQAGVTLIELMIAVAVVTLRAMVAMPSYQDSIRKSRRSEAFNAVAAVQQAQERSRGNFPSYCPNLASSPTLGTCGLDISANTPNGRYALDVSVLEPNAYIVTATAQGAQASDTRCIKMGVQASAGGIKYGSSSGSINWNLADPDVNRCWAK